MWGERIMIEDLNGMSNLSGWIYIKDTWKDSLDDIITALEDLESATDCIE